MRMDRFEGGVVGDSDGCRPVPEKDDAAWFSGCFRVLTFSIVALAPLVIKATYVKAESRSSTSPISHVSNHRISSMAPW